MSSNQTGQIYKEKIREIIQNLERFKESSRNVSFILQKDMMQLEDISRQFIAYIDTEPILQEIEKTLPSKIWDIQKQKQEGCEPTFSVLGNEREAFALQMMKEAAQSDKPYYYGVAMRLRVIPFEATLEYELKAIKKLIEKYIVPLISFFQGRLALLRDKQLEVRIEDIDNFSKISGLSYQEFVKYIPIDFLEDDIQKAFEKIIGEPFHKKDWGGEYNDLFTNRICIDGNRIRVAFLLKGRGVPRILTISDCGRNGDQIQRLFESPADLFIIQHVNYIHESVIKEMIQKTMHLRRTSNPEAQFCVINGINTARILKAYEEFDLGLPHPLLTQKERAFVEPVKRKGEVQP